MQKFLGFQKALGTATAYTKPSISETSQREIPKEAEEIEVLKMRLAKGEISRRFLPIEKNCDRVTFMV